MFSILFILAIFPIALAVSSCIIFILYRRFNYSFTSKNSLLRTIPNYNLNNLAAGCALMLVAFGFFFIGLDDRNDPYRIYHGMWHCTVAWSSYFLWQLHPGPQGFAGCYTGHGGTHTELFSQ